MIFPPTTTYFSFPLSYGSPSLSHHNHNLEVQTPPGLPALCVAGHRAVSKQLPRPLPVSPDPITSTRDIHSPAWRNRPSRKATPALHAVIYSSLLPPGSGNHH